MAELRRRNIGSLPVTLGQAIEELSRDQVVQEALGEHVCHSFLEAKSMEWEDYRRQVTQWELDHYVESF
jgi:glutamine synthetase